jgi:PAS domain S-box-containing protein
MYSSKRPLIAYAFAIACALLAVGLQWAIRPWVGDRVPFLFILPALAYVATTLGRGPAVVVLLAGAINAALLAEPQGSLLIAQTPDVIALVAYLFLGTLLLLYGGRLRVVGWRAALAEERLSLAQAHTGIGVFELDFLHNTAFVSPGLCELLGQPVMQGPIDLDQWLNVLHPDHVSDSRRAIQSQMEKGELRYEREQRVTLPDGRAKWLLSRVRIDVTAKGKLASVHGAAIDISERKLLDEQLNQTRLALHQQVADLEDLHILTQRLVAASDDLTMPLQALLDLVVRFLGAKHGVITLVAADAPLPRLVVHTGFEADRLSSLWPLHYPIDKVHAAGADPAITQDHEVFLESHRAWARAQGFGHTHCNALINTKGQAMGTICILFEDAHSPSEREIRLCAVCAATAAAVVEREFARQDAAATERRFQVALESSIVPFNILGPVRDADGKITDFRWQFVNPAAARALRKSAKELLGHQVGDVVPEAWQAQGLFEHYVSVVADSTAKEFEISYASNGNTLWFQVIASPLNGSAAIWFTDITERKKQEEALKIADRRKDEFLATLAHELRNPLAPIRQAVMIARSAHVAEAKRAWSHDIIERQVQNMALLLDDLLDVSRITQGTLSLRRGHLSLQKLVDAAVEIAQPHIERKQHQLKVEVLDPHVVLDVDALRMSQVLGNLLTNAAKYTENGGSIALRAGRESEEIAISIRDNGIGLSAEQIGSVFAMFAQVPGAVSRSEGGLGIGLALSRGLVELHGGHIAAKSAGLGTGSEFIVRLPQTCVASNELTLESPPIKETSTSPANKPRSILIADDNKDAADSWAEFLRLDGHNVHVVYNGTEALATFTHLLPEIVILDIGMPGLSGLDAARAIRELPAGHKTILVAITGWGQDKDRKGALEAGFDHHFAKPVSPALIRSVVIAERR